MGLQRTRQVGPQGKRRGKEVWCARRGRGKNRQTTDRTRTALWCIGRAQSPVQLAETLVEAAAKGRACEPDAVARRIMMDAMRKPAFANPVEHLGLPGNSRSGGGEAGTTAQALWDTVWQLNCHSCRTSTLFSYNEGSSQPLTPIQRGGAISSAYDLVAVWKYRTELAGFVCPQSQPARCQNTHVSRGALGVAGTSRPLADVSEATMCPHTYATTLVQRCCQRTAHRRPAPAGHPNSGGRP